MNGAHDLGGLHGLGPVDREPDEPVFHAGWERRCFGITLATGFLGQWNIDMSRFARERMEPGEYLRTSYYEHWLHGLEILLVERGLITREELEASRRGAPPPAERAEPGLAAVPVDRVPGILKLGAPTDETVEAAPRFAPGDRVRTRNFHPHGHTRLPRYARDKAGVIERHYGAHVFPDSSAHGAGKDPQHLYNVRIDADTLWGEDATPASSVRLDLWEPYLLPA